MTKCLFCNSDINTPIVKANGSSYFYCAVCGEFDIGESVLLTKKGIEEAKLHIYSGALREQFLKGRAFVLDDMDFLLGSVRVPANPMEQIDKLLQSVESKSQFFGQDVHIDCRTDYPFAYARSPDEFFKLLSQAVVTGYLDAPTSITFPTMTVNSNIAGANRLAELHKNDIVSDQAFVAMWFDDSMDSAYVDGIAPALEATGYRPLIIKNKEHDNKIDDEIFAEINKSGLLIADFTGHRPSVYYEAGYARGLGIRVIHSCREDEIGSAHFDTRQYSHVTWKTTDELKEKLIRRIDAVPPYRRNSSRGLR